MQREEAWRKPLGFEQVCAKDAKFTDGLFMKHSFFTDIIPVVIVLRAMGMQSDQEIVRPVLLPIRTEFGCSTSKAIVLPWFLLGSSATCRMAELVRLKIKST